VIAIIVIVLFARKDAALCGGASLLLDVGTPFRYAALRPGNDLVSGFRVIFVQEGGVKADEFLLQIRTPHEAHVDESGPNHGRLPGQPQVYAFLRLLVVRFKNIHHLGRVETVGRLVDAALIAGFVIGGAMLGNDVEVQTVISHHFSGVGPIQIKTDSDGLDVVGVIVAMTTTTLVRGRSDFAALRGERDAIGLRFAQAFSGRGGAWRTPVALG